MCLAIAGLARRTVEHDPATVLPSADIERRIATASRKRRALPMLAMYPVANTVSLSTPLRRGDAVSSASAWSGKAAEERVRQTWGRWAAPYSSNGDARGPDQSFVQQVFPGAPSEQRAVVVAKESSSTVHQS